MVLHSFSDPPRNILTVIMEDKLDQILNRLTSVESKLDTNNTAVEEMRKELLEIKEGNVDVINSIENLEEKVGNVAEEMENVKQKVKNIETSNKSIENRVIELELSAETELPRTECLVAKYMDGKLKEFAEKVKEKTLDASDVIENNELEVRLKRVEDIMSEKAASKESKNEEAEKEVNV